MTGDAGAKHLGAGITGEGGERVLGRAHDDIADRLAGQRVPTADHPVAAAGQQRAPVGKKGGRPDRQSRSDERAFHFARSSVDDRDRTTHAGGSNQTAVAR